ncbi:MAG: serine hydrolase [Chthoniobacter sp.]|nr:serine hydrolase [Chthoniobacter sp.]
MNHFSRSISLSVLLVIALVTGHAADTAPLASVLQSAVDKHLVAGTVVLVADKDRVLDVEAAGYSNLDAKTAMKPDAMFWIASMSKSYTGVALMMLVDEGKVKLDDPVEKYLPEFKDQMVEEDGIERHPPAHPITVQGQKIPEPLLDNFGGGVATDIVNHYAQPAGGLYATAGDVGRLCQMLLNGGTWHGRRYLSEEAIKTLSANQAGNVPVNPAEGYGVGCFVKIKNNEGPEVGSYGHRGARRTVMWVDPKNQLVMVAMIQRWDMTGEQQNEFYGSVFKAMVEKFGRKQ